MRVGMVAAESVCHSDQNVSEGAVLKQQSDVVVYKQRVIGRL